MALGFSGPVVARARTVVDTDTSGMHKGLAGAERRFGSAARGLQSLSTRVGSAIRTAFRVAFVAVGAALAAGTLAAGKFIRAASDLGEELNKSRVVFGRHSREVIKWSKTTAESLGISRRAALEYAGVFGNMLVPMGFAREEAAKMSVRLIELAADMASFNNASPEETLEALRAGLAGETEPLRRFGIFLSEARIKQEALNLGLVKGKEELDETEKAAARYSLILKDTKDAQGDVSRTADGLANRERRLRAKLEDVAAGFGKFLIPAAEAGAEKLEDVLDFLGDVAKAKSPKVAVQVAIEGIRGGLGQLREQIGELLFGRDAKRIRVPIDQRHFEWRFVGGREGLLDAAEGFLVDTFSKESMFGRSGQTVAVPVEGGKLTLKVVGSTSGWVNELENALTGAAGQVDWERVSRVAATVGGGLARFAIVLAALLARLVAKAIQEIDWKLIGSEIAKGIGGGVQEGWDSLKKEDWFALDDLSFKNVPGNLWDAVKPPDDFGKGFGDLFGKIEGDAQAASKGSATAWEQAMARVRATGERALASVRGDLAATSTSGLRAKDRIEDFRNELNRVPSRKDVKVDVEIAFFGSGGVRFNPGGISGADGVISAGIRGAVQGTVAGMSPAALGVSPRGDVSPALWDELAIGQALGLGVSSTFRPGAITSTGNRSLHGVYPSQAVDLASGSSAGYGDPRMRAAFNAFVGRPGIDEVILSPYWWHPGSGMGRIPSSAGSVLADHWDHVHVGDRQGDGMVGALGDVLRSPFSTRTGRFAGDGIRGLPRPPRKRIWDEDKNGKRFRRLETGKEYRRRLAQIDVARLPAWIELPIARAELTKGLQDDIAAWRRAEKRLMRARNSGWITRRQRIDVLRELNSVRDTLAGLREDRAEQRGGITREEAEAQAKAFAEIRSGFLSEFAPNIFGTTTAGLTFGSSPLAGGGSPAAGSGKVTVNQYFAQPPEDPTPLMRTAEFAAAAAFGGS